MRVGIIQPSFIPWRGYFDFINSVDLFIFHDDTQYTKADWRNRNRIKTSAGLKWLTVPVASPKTSQLIFETTIDYQTDWQKKHLSQWTEHYRKAPYFEDVKKILITAFSFRDRSISELDIRLIRLINGYLAIDTPLTLSSSLAVRGVRTEKLINILKAVSADEYLSGPSAEGYIEKDAFKESGVTLFYKSYEYEPYPQIYGSFEGNVSILDLIANCGPESMKWLRSSKPDQVILSV